MALSALLAKVVRQFPHFIVRCVCEPHKVGILLWKCFFWWSVPRASSNIDEGEYIWGFPGSDCIGGITSQTNGSLAKYVVEVMNSTRIFRPSRVLLQGELARAVEKLGIAVTWTSPCQTVELGSEGYIESNDAFQEAARLSEGAKHIIVIAMVPYIWRLIWMLERLGFIVIIPANMPWHIPQKNLSQPRWRYWFTAIPYELVARLYSLYMGLI